MGALSLSLSLSLCVCVCMCVCVCVIRCCASTLFVDPSVVACAVACAAAKSGERIPLRRVCGPSLCPLHVVWRRQEGEAPPLSDLSRVKQQVEGEKGEGQADK